jgi:hypothetical protein
VSTLGEAILDAALAVREILDQVDEQKLEQERTSRSGAEPLPHV